MEKGSFIIYDSDLENLDFLTELQTGKLFKAPAKYRLKGTEPNFGNNPAPNILFQQLVTHITINEEKYKAICQKNSESAKKRWQNNSMRTHAKLCVNDNDNDNDYDNDYDNDNDNEPCGAKREKRKNYYGKKNDVPTLLRDEPTYDAEAFMRKAIGLKYQKKDDTAQ